jgi:hypothetical protein
MRKKKKKEEWKEITSSTIAQHLLRKVSGPEIAAQLIKMHLRWTDLGARAHSLSLSPYSVSTAWACCQYVAFTCAAAPALCASSLARLHPRCRPRFVHTTARVAAQQDERSAQASCSDLVARLRHSSRTAFRFRVLASDGCLSHLIDVMAPKADAIQAPRPQRPPLYNVVMP